MRTAHLCPWCNEEVTATDVFSRVSTFGPDGFGEERWHLECQTRSIVGSVAHQTRTCTCHGGAEEDDPGLTRREAAMAALQYFELMHPDGS